MGYSLGAAVATGVGVTVGVGVGDGGEGASSTTELETLTAEVSAGENDGSAEVSGGCNWLVKPTIGEVISDGSSSVEVNAGVIDIELKKPGSTVSVLNANEVGDGSKVVGVPKSRKTVKKKKTENGVNIKLAASWEKPSPLACSWNVQIESNFDDKIL